MPLRIPAEVTGLEASVQAAAKKAGRNLKLNLGTNSKSIEGLSQPLGRITGKADQFTKSMEAANARVLAFGASVGVLNAVTQGFKDLVTTTIQVEKSMAAINAILGKTTGELNRFKGAIFDVARNTEQSFDTVAEAALELSRQGLEAEEVTARLNDALILARLSGQGAAEAVAGLTSAINGFKKSGITSTQVVNKFSEAAKNAAVSERDLAEAFKRAGAVAGQAGVSFDELAGIVSAVQQKTSRGGAVIGNSFKTIFTRLQSLDKLQTMQNLGVKVTDASGDILNATQLIKNLASSIKDLPEAKQLQIAEDLVGKFQVAPFVSILEDFNDQQSIAIKLTQISQNASTAAYERNTVLNNTLSTAINTATVNLKELFDTLGSIGVTDQLKTIVGFFSGLAENINKVLEGDSIGSKFAKGIVKGIGNVLSGPGLAIFGAILLKLTADLAKFGVGSLQTFFGLNKAAKEQATLQGQIASTLLNNKGVQQSIMAIENSTLSIEQKRVAQTKFFTTALNEQLAVMTRMQSIASRVAPGVMVGTRGRGRGRGAAEGFVPNYNATMGYAPNFAAESSDIARGVGGAPRSARPVAIPNFNFGGGQRGSMVANTSEFIVPNFAGTGGSAIFNQDMISSMGMPSGAKSIGAAGGFIPNFASRRQRAARLQQFNQGGKNFGLITGKRGGDKLGRIIYVSDADDKKGGETFTINPKPNTFGAVSVPTFQLPTKGSSRRAGSLDINKVAGKISQFSTNRAVENAKLLSGRNDMPRPLQKKFIESQLNVGSVKGMAGTVFEASLTALLSDQKFKDVQSMTATSLIDLPKSPLLYSAFGIPTGMAQQGVEVKGTGSTSLIADAARKFYQVEAKNRRAFTFKKGTMQSQTIGRLGSAALARAGNKRGATKNTLFGDLTPNQRRTIEAAGGRVGSAGAGLAFAGGYIPNFAMGALDQAVARESAAGLPINQIRINQDSSLRNAGNPMGLAVTNMRDEPTGAIPNFARRPMGEGGGGDLFAKIFAVQTAFMMLTPVIGEVTEQNKALAGAMTALNVAISAMFVSQAFGGGAGGALGILNPFGGGTASKLSRKGQAAQLIGQRTFGRATTATSGAALRGSIGKMGGGVAMQAGAGALRMVPFVAAIAAGTFGISKLSDAFKGTGDILASSSDMVAKASKHAAAELAKLQVPDEFKKEQVERGKEEGANIVEQILRSRGDDAFGVIGAALEGITFGLLKGRLFGNIEGGEDKALLKELDEAVSGAVTRGGNKTEIDKITTGLLSIAQERKITLAEIQTAIDNLTKITVGAGGTKGTKGDPSATIAEIFSNFQREGFKVGKGEDAISGRDLLRNIRAIDVVDQRLERGEKTKIQAERGLPVGRTVAEEQLQRVTTNAVRKALREADLQTNLAEGLMKGIGLERAEEIQVDDRIANQVFIERIRHLTELEKLNTAVVDDAKSLVQELQAADSIDKSLLSNAKLKVSEAEADQRLRDKILTTTVDIVKLGKDLTVTTTQELALRKAITTANSDGKIELDEQAKLIALASQIATKQGDEIRGSLQNLRNGVVETRTQVGLDKERLRIIQEQNEELRLQNVQLDIRETQAKIDFLKPQASSRLAVQGGIEQESLLQRRIANSMLGGSTLDEEAGQRRISASKIRQADLQRFNEQMGFEENQTEKIISFLNDKRANFEEIFNVIPRKMLQELTGDALVNQISAIQTKLEEASIKRDPRSPDNSTLKFESKDFKLFNTNIELIKQEIIASQNSFAQATNASSELLKEVEKFQGIFVGKSVENLLINRRVSNARDINKQFLGAESNTSNIERLRGRRRVGLESRISSRFQESLLGGEPFSIDEERDMRRQFEFTDKLVQASNVFAQNIGAAMVDAIARGADLGEVLQSAASNFFNTLSSAFMQSAVDDIVGGFGGGISAAASGLTGLTFANSGGMIRGGSGTRDDVPTLLTGGEFVMRKSAVQRYGPEFMAALNSGRVGGMQTGGMFTPGTFGQGAITGKSDLLSFSTQSFTGGSNDILGGSGGLGFASLEPQSGRLTMFGRRNSPMFQREQESKRAAFGLYARQVQLEEQEKERAKQQRKALLGSIVAAVAGVALKGITNQIFGKAPKANPNQTQMFRAQPVGGASSVFSNTSVTPNVKNPYARLGREGVPPLPRGANSNRGFVAGEEFFMNTRLATGGYVSPRAGIDNVPSMLSGGEFVMNAAATQRIGAGNLAAANAGGGGGEGKEAVVARLDELIAVTQNSGETVINITVNSDGSQTEEGSGGEEEQNLARRIRDVVKQTIDDEQRLGGSLRRV